MRRSVSPDSSIRIGIDLGGTKIEAVAMDAQGQVCQRRRVPTPRDDYPGTLQAIAGLVAAIEVELDCTAQVGIGTPGTLSPATGLVKNSNSTWINEPAPGSRPGSPAKSSLTLCQ